MYCRNCGNEVSDNAVVCPKCGASLAAPNTHYNSSGNPVQDNSKTVAIVAHITLIGWVIALVMNSQQKTEFGSFYVRQMLGLLIFNIIGICTTWLFFVGFVILIFNFVVWLISLINAINNETTPIPVYGNLFQTWFKGM